jgi:hypothetical protein
VLQTISYRANAVAETGGIATCEGCGNRVGTRPFAAGSHIIVTGTNKIVPTLQEIRNRIWNYAFRQENARAQKDSDTPSRTGKWVLLDCEKVAGRLAFVLNGKAPGY